MNTFKSKTINISRVSNPSAKNKIHEKNLYDKFHTKDATNERYNYKTIPLKLMESKSNSKEKINKALKKFEKNINFSKEYCVTLNQQSEQKPKYFTLHTHSNSNDKNKPNRPSTAIQKNKNNKLNNEGFIIYNQRNFTEFNNFRDNLLSNSKKEKDNNINKKLLSSNISKNITLNKPFNKSNNKLFIKTNNNDFFNKNILNTENNNIYNRTIHTNEKRLVTPKIAISHFISESNRPKSGKKLKLASGLIFHKLKEK